MVISNPGHIKAEFRKIRESTLVIVVITFMMITFMMITFMIEISRNSYTALYGIWPFYMFKSS